MKVDSVYVLPNGSHVLTVQDVADSTGAVLSSSNVSYKVAEHCTNSSSTQCNMDQIGLDNTQNDCNPRIEALWLANPCGPGVQGVNPVYPRSTLVQSVSESSAPPDQNNLTLSPRC